MTTSDAFRKRLGDKIRKVRDLRGYSEDYMAQQLGISQRQYSRYELGENDPGVERLESIATLLGLSLVELLSFDEQVFFSQCTGALGVNSHNEYHAANEKERELYEAIIREKDQRIVELKAEVDRLQQVEHTLLEKLRLTSPVNR